MTFCTSYTGRFCAIWQKRLPRSACGTSGYAAARGCAVARRSGDGHSAQISAGKFAAVFGRPRAGVCAKQHRWNCADCMRSGGLYIPHKNPLKISSRRRVGRGGNCVCPAAASRKTLTQNCSIFRMFHHISVQYPHFPFRPMPSEKGSRTGAGVRLRVHHVCRCGIHGSGGY